MTEGGTGVPVVCVTGNSSVRLWGLDGRERLRRQLRALGIAQTLTDQDALPHSCPAVLLRGDHLFDDRTLRDLLKAPNTVLLASGPPEAAAAHVAADSVPQARAVLSGALPPEALPATTVRTPATLSSGYVGKLRKFASPLLLPIRPERTAALERYLFDGAYKGVTDLVTKWVWPLPARWVTHVCVQLGITPNAVTATSLVLVILATLFFARGSFGLGLVLAWIMTFLDTVDGKLARVTVTSTKFGHLFDHGIDLIHPPLWYVAWGYGVAGSAEAELSLLQPTFIAIIGGYVAGRLVEGLFSTLLGFSLFTWQPVDSYFRLVTARRNPNLILLTVFGLAHLPRWGLIAVAIWTVLSTLLLILRLAQASYVRATKGRLHPWLEDIAGNLEQAPGFARPFIPNGAVLNRLVS